MVAENAMEIIVPTLFDVMLTDIGLQVQTVPKMHADQLFTFFKNHKLFNWHNTNNCCEGRADAVCVLLETWGIPNYKGWVFSGAYLKNHIGGLKQNWKYHVAPILPVDVDGKLLHYVLDPATADTLQLVEDWAAGITLLPHSYYFFSQAHWYIFPGNNIGTATWNTRNKQNRKWMIQCLAGINGLSNTGKAKLCFGKARIKKTLSAFELAKREKPFLSLD